MQSVTNLSADALQAILAELGHTSDTGEDGKRSTLSRLPLYFQTEESRHQEYLAGLEITAKENLEKGIKEGIEIGIERARARRIRQIAQKMLLKQMPLEEIREITNLSVEELQAMQAELEHSREPGQP